MRGSIAARPAPPAETFSGTNRSERRKCEILLTLPIRNTTISRSQTWGHSSAGRAPAWHAGGRRFDPAWLHHNLSVDQRPIDRMMQVSASPSSRGLGHHPFTVDTGVRIPVGTPLYKQTGSSRELPVLLCAIGASARALRRILRVDVYSRHAFFRARAAASAARRPAGIRRHGRCVRSCGACARDGARGAFRLRDASAVSFDGCGCICRRRRKVSRARQLLRRR